MYKKLLFILLLTILSFSGYGQTVFTQTFVDRCTNEVKVVTANFVNGQLHSTSGKNVGHYLENYNIFIDMSGRCLGEIIFENRLLYNTQTPWKGFQKRLCQTLSAG